VVQIRDIAETEDGRPYLVMDFATEGTLEQRMIELAQRQVRPGPFHLRVVARAIADALGVLHDRRIAHRDIKPSNMLITRASMATGTLDPARTSGPSIEDAVLRPGERLMLGDLGLAKDLAFDSGITVGVGTAGYMAPEQSLAGGKIDVRTDIYAATALLMQIASGDAPDPVRRVSGGRVEVGRPVPANIPPVLAAALLRGLDADPDRRPQTIQAWLADVDAALIAVETGRDFAPPAAAPLGPPPMPSAVAAPAPPPLATPQPASATDPRRTRRFAIVGAAALVVAGAVGIGLAMSQDDDPAASDESTEDATDPSDNGSALGDPFVEIEGPSTIVAGQPARWDVEWSGVASGTWSLTGPVQPDPPDWEPGDGFEGTWNYALDDLVLTLVARDEDGNIVDEDSIQFDVVDG